MGHERLATHRLRRRLVLRPYEGNPLFGIVVCTLVRSEFMQRAEQAIHVLRSLVVDRSRPHAAFWLYAEAFRKIRGIKVAVPPRSDLDTIVILTLRRCLPRRPFFYSPVMKLSASLSRAFPSIIMLTKSRGIWTIPSLPP